ncbi:MAG: Crp/Fnr family transcriptional regulator [Candidatus Moranbacteria bacterium]|nr:Crp/Fnr family transcriptional regulator [Candidatus Moranbacteria bacterium]
MLDSLFINSCTISSRGCACFEKLTPSEMELIENNQVELTYRKGEIICKQGSLAPHVIFLTKGLVKAYIESCNENLVLKIISEKKFIALSSAMEGSNVFHYSCQAYIDCTVKLIDVKIFRQILKSNATFAAEIFNVQSANAMQIYGRFFCLTQKQSYGRLADILLCLSDNVFGKNSFNLELSRKEIAELSGMTQESVVRILKKFKDEKLIATSGKMIEILDYEKLQQISQRG